MRIALDYDDTYSLNPKAWDAAIAVLESHGATVFGVTCRRDTDENRREVKMPVPVMFTGLTAKKWFMEEKRGLKIDVWIDDDPACVVFGK